MWRNALHCADRVDIDFPAGGVDYAEEGVQVGAAGDHLPAVLAVYSFHQGGGGADDVGLGEAETGDPVVQLFAQEQGFVLRTAAVLVAVGEFDELAKWRVAVAA